MRKFFIAITAAMSLLSASAEVTYKYDESTKTLTFSGDGEMNVYTTDIFGDTYINPEWSNLKDEVEHVVVNEGVTNIGKHAFMSFSKLKDVKIASTVEKIDVAAFEECKDLAEITLPEGLKEFGEEAFYGCSSLTSISIPEKVTYLPDYIFQSCKSLKNIDLGNVRKFGKQVFQYCGFEKFVIPDGVKTLSENMFFSCRNMKTIDIPACVDTIEYGAFYYCELDTINFLGETFPVLTGSNNFTLDNKEKTPLFRINCNAYNGESVDAIKEHGAYYNSKIIPLWTDGTDVYSNNPTYGPLTITPVDCDKNLYKLSVDLWSSSYQVTWEGTYNVPEEDLHSTEIVVDLSTPATVIANVEYGSNSSNISLSADVYGKGKVDIKKLSSSSESATFKLTATPDEGYKFSRWEPFGFGIKLTEEQKTNPEIEVTITYTNYIDAYFTKIDTTPGSPDVNYCGKDGGKNVTWKVQNDTLFVLGEGEMEDYSIYDDTPFYFEKYTYIYVGEGITNVGEASFANLYSIKEVYLPSTITKVGVDAFAYCEKLENIYFAGATPPTFDKLSYIFDEIKEVVQIVVPCDAVNAYKEVLTDMKVICGNTAVDDVDADEIVVVVADGRITVDRDDFRIYDVLGRDVTSSNGSLTSGVYVVKCEGQTQKVVVR